MFVCEKFARILGSFDKQTARAQTAGDPQVTRQGVSEQLTLDDSSKVNSK